MNGTPITLILAFTWLALPCRSQHLHWDTDDGLSNAWVSAIVQDCQGYLWIGTQYGLNRFDGLDFDDYHYRPNDSTALRSNWVRHITTVGDHIYLHTEYGGLQRLDPEQGVITHITHSDNAKAGQSIHGLYTDNKGVLWQMSRGRLLRLHEMDTLQAILDQSIRCMDQYADGMFALFSSDSVHFMYEGSIIQSAPWPHDVPNSVLIDRADRLWVSTASGVYQVVRTSSDEISTRRVPIQDINTPILFAKTDMLEDREGRLWIPGEYGLNLIDTSRSLIEHRPYQDIHPALTDNTEIQALFEDHIGGIWLGTNKGIVYMSPWGVRSTNQSGISTLTKIKGARSFHVQGDKIWVGSERGLYEVTMGEHGSVLQKIFDKHVYALCNGPDSALYIGSGQGIYRRSPGDRALKNIGLEYNIKGGSWDMLRQGAYLWIVNSGRLLRLHPENKTVQRISIQNNQGGEVRVGTDIEVDHHGRVWVATLSDGVFCLTNTTSLGADTELIWRQYNYDPSTAQSLSSDLALCMTPSRDSGMWVGTDGGLNHIGHDGTIHRYLQGSWLEDDKFMSLHEDTTGRLWASTIGHGILGMKLDDQDVIYLDKTDGLPSNNYNLNSGLLLPEGLLLMGSDQGTAVIDLQQFGRIHRTTSPFMLQSMNYIDKDGLVHDATPKHGTALELAYQDNAITVDYHMIQYYRAEQTRYSYRLLPHQQTWQDHGHRRQLRFDFLPAGRHTLEIRAEHPLVQPAPDTLRQVIIIKPPWWRSIWAYLVYAIGGIGIVIASYFLIKRRLRRRQAQELFALKDQLYTDISHEIRSPLTVIMSAAQRQRQHESPQVQSSAQLTLRSGRRLLGLVDKLLVLARLDSGHEHLELVPQELNQYVKYVMDSLHLRAEEKDITLTHRGSAGPVFSMIDLSAMQHVLTNLLHNAMGHSPAGSEIVVALSTHEDKAIIKVIDSGDGIPEDALERVFHRYHRHTDRREGTGVGLAIVRAYIQRMNGSIRAYNHTSGCTFELTLPLIKEAPIPERSLAPQLDAAVEEEDARAVILVIEDHPEIRHMLAVCLSPHYQVTTSIDGALGLATALEVVPDLVISDIMMPGMDGYEVSRALKGDPRTDHIPIILLTAKADKAAKMKGWKAQVDDYIAKPFDVDDLLLRIEGLLANRARLAAKYAVQAPMPISTDMAATPEDRFVQSARDIILAHMDDANFSIHLLCQALAISRVQLHRKLKATTQQSASIFIRNIRLDHAYTLLSDTDKNVSETAYAVGFSDPSYFSKLFKDRFGHPPSQMPRA